MKISFDVPEVPSIITSALTLPPEFCKLRPGVFASAVLCNVIFAAAVLICSEVSGELTEPIPT